MKPPLDPGELKVRLELLAPVETPDGAGGHETSFAFVRKVWARLDPAGETVVERGGSPAQRSTRDVTIRHAGDVRPGMRFRLGVRLLAIETVWDPDGSGRLLVCRTIETEVA